MTSSNKGRGSVERIVQKLPINKDATKETSPAPVRNIGQSSLTLSISAQPARTGEIIQQPLNTQISPKIVDEVPVTIVIETESDHNIMPEEQPTEPTTAADEPPPTESTRIGDKDINISIEHSLSEDEGGRNPKQVGSPHSSYSTAPWEIPHRATLEQSPISSLDPEDIDHLNNVFDI